VIDRVTVVKIGGNEVDNAEWLQVLARDVAGGPAMVLVHGGGREISALQRVLGSEPEWREGLRYTSPEALRAACMVLSGLVNKRIVAALLSAGRDALGLSGEDGGLLHARLLLGGAMGRTGEITRVRVELLQSLLQLGLLPVVSPIARGEDGNAVNVNADEAAAAVAAALGASELLLVSDVAGVRADGGVLSLLDVAEVEEMIAAGIAAGGMVPKLRAAATALRGGAQAVRVGDLRMLTDPAAGTRIVAATGNAAVA
jgi:acetylglutamate kinase